MLNIFTPTFLAFSQKSDFLNTKRRSQRPNSAEKRQPSNTIQIRYSIEHKRLPEVTVIESNRSKCRFRFQTECYKEQTEYQY